MKNKICYVFLYIIACFAFMDNVFAFEYSVYADFENNKDTVLKGETAKVLIGIRSSEAVSSCIFKVSSDSSLELVDSVGQTGNGWVQTGTGDNGILVENSMTSNSMTDGKYVLSLTYKVNDDGDVTIKSECSPLNGNELGTYEDISVSIKSKDISEDYTLSSLNVTGGKLEPNFSPDVFDYVLVLDSPSFGLEMTASNSDYNDNIKVTKDDGTVINDLSNISFSDPSSQAMMPLLITVNETTVYSILAVYEKKELDNGLSFLKVDGKDILEPGKNEYVINVPSTAREVFIEAGLKDEENFMFDQGFETGEVKFNLSSINHLYTVVVLPKKDNSGGVKNEYAINIIKDSGGSVQGSSSSSSKTHTPSSSKPNGGYGNTNHNPTTGGVSMGLMAVILIVSLFGSVILYKKNLAGYDK